jgi:hypothetical protein
MDQGECGCVSLTTFKGRSAVCKISNRVDYSIELEHEIAQKLQTLKSSHFCELYGTKLRDGVLSMYSEYIEYEGKTLTLADSKKKCDSRQMTSLLDRTLIAAAIMNEQLGITHNDLHGSNVMIRKCDADIAMYEFPDGTTFTFKTHGMEPVLIDFGLAYGKTSRMKTTTTFVDIGYFPFESDPIIDACRVLYRVNDRFAKLDEIAMDYVISAQAIIDKLPLSRSGWYKPGTFPDIMEELCELLAYDHVNENPVDSSDDRESTSDESTSDETESSDTSRHSNDGVLKPCRKIIDLFTAAIRLPLVKSKRIISVYDAYAAFKSAYSDSEIARWLTSEDKQYDFIKTLLDKRVSTVKKLYSQFSKRDLWRLKLCSKHVIVAINNYVYDQAMEASRLKKTYVKKTGYASIVQILKSLVRPQSKFNRTDRLKIYNVATATTEYCTWNEYLDREIE